VRYSASTGQQIATVNRLGFVTTFTWESNAYNGFGGILFIDKRDVGEQYGTQWEGPGMRSGPPAAIYTEEAIIAHESGHGYAYYFLNNTKREAVVWENEVHRREGRPLRSQSCHVK
jgi:hypothetical protein